MSESFDLTTYYAKRIIGDSAASAANKALLQSGADASMWIFGHSRSNYGIKYLKDSSSTADKIEFHGGHATNSTAWIQLDTGDASFYDLYGNTAELAKSIQITTTGYGLYLTDSVSKKYAGIYDNGTNLWVGATSSGGQHHKGNLYLSAGHNGTTGNKSIYISIPANGNSSTSHTAYALVYKDATGSATQPIYVDSDGKTIACNDYTTLFTKLSWTAGNSSGPVLDVTIGGTNKTATIPSASASASGIVTTGTQTFCGIKTFYRESTTGQNYATGIQFENKDTTTGQTQTGSKTYIYAYNTHAAEDNGMNMVIRPGGNLFVGGGESAGNLYATLTSSTTENLYLTADTTLYLEAGANTIANRIGIAISSAGHILPQKAESANNNAQNIGASDNKFANIYATTFIGALNGNADSATKLATAREIYVALGSTRDTSNKITFDGTADKAIHVSGTLGTARGGTGVTSHTANRLVWSSDATHIQAANHYASASKVAIAYASEPNETFLVNGSARINSILHLYRSSTTEQNYAAGIKFINKDTTIDQEQDTTYIYAYNTHAQNNSGMNLVIRSAGNIFIGGGESPNSLYNTMTTSTSENLFLTGDTAIYLESNANTIENRIGMSVNTAGAIVPVKAETANDGQQNIGTSTNRWANLYLSDTATATHFNGVGVSTNWVKGRDGAIFKMTSISSYSTAVSVKTTNGSWEIGAYDNSDYTDDLLFTYCTDSDYSNNNNNKTAQIKFLENGRIVADLSGSATSATLLTGNQAVRTSLTKGTNPSSTTWLSSWFNYQTGTGTAVSDRVGGGIESNVDANGATTLYLRAYKYASGSSDVNMLSITCAKDGTCTYSVSDKAAFRTAIGAGTSSLAIGTTGSTAAAGNHTHTLTIATDSGTNALSFAYGTKYKLTAGGSTYIFTTPSLGTTATTAAAGNHNHDDVYAKLSGATFSGDTWVVKASGAVYDAVQRSDTGLACYLHINSSSTNHGVYSSGYYDGTTYTASGNWLIYRNSSGVTTVNGNCTGNANTANKLKTARTIWGQSFDGSGDITGNLTAVGNLYNKNSTSDLAQSNNGLSANTGNGFYGLDKNGKEYTRALSYALTSGETRLYLQVRNHNGSAFTTYGGIVIKQSKSANTITYEVTNGANFRSAISAAASDHNHDSTYLKLSGGQLTGALLGSNTNLGSTTYGEHFGQLYLGRSTSNARTLNSGNPLIEFADNNRNQYAQIIYTDYDAQGGSDSITFVSNQSDLRIFAPKVHGAVWNDYAECRQTEKIEPGYCLVETSTGVMKKCNKRMAPGCRIASDTYGMLIGETDKAKTPIAIAGRVLVHTYRSPDQYQLGVAVCSAPDGTVDIMTREEIMQYPECIIGTVSEIPTYDTWYAGQYDQETQRGRLEIPVNGRIWIYVR